MCKAPWVSVAIGLVATSTAFPARAPSFPLSSKTVGPEDFGSSFLHMAIQWEDREESKPEGLKAAPANLPEDAYFFALHLGGNTVFALLLPGKSPKLYIDSDIDSDLSDEKPVTGKRLKSGTFGWGTGYLFESFPAPSSQPSDKAAPTLQASLLNNEYLIVMPTSYRSGTVEIKGKRYRIRVVDANYNGRYDDVAEFGSRGKGRTDSDRLPTYDSLAIDLNGDGEYSASSDASAEIMPLPKLLRFGEDYFALRVARDGSEVTVEKTAPRFGTLDVGYPDAELLLWSENGVHHLKGSDGKWKLPEGNYSCYMIRINTTDAKKNKYMLTCRGNTGKLTDFDIAENKTASFKIGPPLAAQAKVNLRREMFRRTAVISASVVGHEGEEYLAGVQKNSEMQPAPGIKILDSAGKVVESGKLEYG